MTATIKLSPQGEAVLDRAMTSIALNPDAWNQGTWDCGTTACLAGHINRNEGKLSRYPTIYGSGELALIHLGLDLETGDGLLFFDRIFSMIEYRPDGNGYVQLDGKNPHAFDLFATKVEELTGMDFSHQRELYAKHFED